MIRHVLKVTGKDRSRYLTARSTGDFAQVKFQEIAILSPQGKVQGCYFTIPVAEGILLIPDHDPTYDENAATALKAYLAADRVKTEPIEAEVGFALPKVKDSLESYSLNPLNEYEITENQGYIRGFFDIPTQNLVGIVNFKPSSSMLEAADLALHRFKTKSPVVGRDVPYEISLGEIQTAPFQALKKATKGCFTGQEMVEKIISGKARPPKILSYGSIGINEDIANNAKEGLYIDDKQIGTVLSYFGYGERTYLYLSVKFDSLTPDFNGQITIGPSGIPLTI